MATPNDSEVQGTDSEEQYLHLKEVEITFKGVRPKNKFMIALDVQDDRRYKSNVLGRSGDIRWKNDIYLKPTAVAKLSLEVVHGTDFRLKLTRDYASIALDFAKHRVVANNSIIIDVHPKIKVKLDFADPIPLRTIVRLLSTNASSALASKVDFLDKIDKVLSFTSFVLELGEIAGQVGSFAGVASSSARMAFDRCQAISEAHQIAVDLVDDIVSMLPVPDMLRGRTQEPETRKQLMDFLELIKDTMNVLTQYAAHSTSSFYLRNWFDSKHGTFVRLKQRLDSMKQNTNLFLGASTYLLASQVHDSTKEVQKAVVVARDLQLLDRLCPVTEATYDPDRGCLEGTRMKFLDDISTKIENSDAKLCWVYGVAGSGKSTISVSVASNADDKGMLGGCFFFQRDIPELRSPRKILPTLSHSLSQVYAPYRKHVLSILEDKGDIAAKAPKVQLAALFGKNNSIQAPKNPYVFVVDALDECGEAQDRAAIGSCLVQLTQNIPWLKVIVTSRPTYEIQQAFEEPEESEEGQSEQHQAMVSFDLNAADDVESDIYKYNETWLKRVRKLLKKWRQPEWIRILTQRACGLFIWSSTVAKYVSDALDCNIALEQVFNQTSAPAKSPFDTLDELYRFVLEQVQGDKLIIKKALGILVCTAKNRPLTLKGLYDLLPAGSIDEGLSYTALETILERLQSVLYTDASVGDVVRVCHPSFLEFMSAKERAGSFWTDPSEVNAELYRRCMHLMDKGLKFNICKLESAYLLNSEIRNLRELIWTNVPAALQYSCIYWIDHLLNARDVCDMQDPSVQLSITKLLCDVKCLFWLEVLSLTATLKAGINALGYCLREYQLPNKLAVASADLFKFATGFYDVVNASTPHLYLSALPWAPSDSYVHKELASKFDNQHVVVSGKARRWNPILWSSMASDAFVRVKFSPDGSLVASAMLDISGSNGFILLWSVQTGEVLGEPFARKENTKYITELCVEFSPDAKCLAVCTGKGELTFWDPGSRKRIVKELKGAIDVTCFKYSPTGDAFLAASDNTFRAWDLQTGDVILGPIATHTTISCLCYSPDSEYIITGFGDGQLRVWKAKDGCPVGESFADDHIESVKEISFSPDSRFFCSASGETLRLWNTKDRRILHAVTVTSKVSDLAYSPDGRYIITAAEYGEICFWEVIEDRQNTALEARQLSGSYGAFPCISCSLDGRYFATGSLDETMRLWDVHAILEFEELRNVGNGHTSDVITIDYSPDGKTIVSASGDRSIRFWSSETGKMLGEPILNMHSSANYSPEGEFVVSSGGGNSVCIWSVATRELVKTLASSENSNYEFTLYSHDGRRVVGYSVPESKVVVWDSHSGEALGNSGDAFSANFLQLMAISPNTNHAIIMTDKAHTVYDFEAHKCVFDIADRRAFSCSYYSRDGKYIARGSQYNLYLHDVRTGEVLGEPISIDHSDIAGVGAVSPDGRYVGLTSINRKVWILDTERKKIVAGPVSGHSEIVIAIDYSPDGQYIATGATDDTIRIWDTEFLMKHAGRQRDTVITVFRDGTTEVIQGNLNEQGQTSAIENKTVARRVLPEGVAKDGWYRNSEGGLLFWIPPDYRIDAVDMSKICIPPSARRELDYDFECLSRFQGKSWANVYFG